MESGTMPQDGADAVNTQNFSISSVDRSAERAAQLAGLKNNAASISGQPVPLPLSASNMIPTGGSGSNVLPEGEPNCVRCRTLATQNARLNVSMANFRAMYANLHRDYMQLYTSHNNLADQNTSLMKANALLEEQAKYMKKVTEKEDTVLSALRSFRTQRKLIRKEKGRRDRASQVQKVLASFAEHALPEDIKIRQVDFVVEYKKEHGERVFDVYTLRDGKRTKIKNERERARILGLKDMSPTQLRAPPPLKRLQTLGRTSRDDVDGLGLLPQHNLPGHAVNLQLLQAAYDDQCLRGQQQQRVGNVPYGLPQNYVGPSAYGSTYPSTHVSQYGHTYDILPPLPSMTAVHAPPGTTHDALLQMQLANNMQRVGMWNHTGQEGTPQ